MCMKCTAGKYIDVEGSTGCKDCEKGFFCPAGSSAKLPCPGGRFGTSTDLASATECELCPRGSFCPSGSTTPTNCSVANSAPNEGMAFCDLCLEGTFQDEEGTSACKACPFGYFCPDGSAAPIPASCDPGTWVIGNFTSKADCIDCPLGHSCAGGPAQPSICLPGTVAPRPGYALCVKVPCQSFSACGHAPRPSPTTMLRLVARWLLISTHLNGSIYLLRGAVPMHVFTCVHSAMPGIIRTRRARRIARSVLKAFTARKAPPLPSRMPFDDRIQAARLRPALAPDHARDPRHAL